MVVRGAVSGKWPWLAAVKHIVPFLSPCGLHSSHFPAAEVKKFFFLPSSERFLVAVIQQPHTLTGEQKEHLKRGVRTLDKDVLLCEATPLLFE